MKKTNGLLKKFEDRFTQRAYLFLPVFVFLSCNKPSETVTVQKRTITESVYASVVVQPDSLYYVHAIVSGILDRNLFEEGSMVRAGDPIIQIINNAPKLNTQNSKLAYELALQNYHGSTTILKSIQDEIKAAQLEYENDSINFDRQSSLWKQNIGSKSQYDTSKLKFELSRNNLNLLKDKLQRTENELKNTVEQRRNAYEASVINTKDFTINSKMNGKIYALYKEPGELISTTEPIAAIGSAYSFVIKMLVDEVDIVKVKPDQTVLLTLDAYHGRVLEATVDKIYPQKDERNQTFMVDARFKDNPPRLYPGLSGEANVIISYKKNALTIPKSFLYNSNQVLTEEGLVNVTLGVENLEYIEILSGVTESTTIFKQKE